jgi:ferritin-like metal-binding protein YciE
VLPLGGIAPSCVPTAASSAASRSRRYGTLIAWAESLGRDDVIRLLTTNLNEEKAADKKLSSVAVRKGVNRKAAS